MNICLDIKAWPDSKSSDQQYNIQEVSCYKLHLLKVHARPNNILISIPDNKVEDILSKFMNDLKMGDTVYMWKVAIQRHLNKLEKGAERNLRKFSKENCEVPYLWQSNSTDP